ncbi:MAG TPA: phosphoglucomutase, partial [Bacteroidales bacterium]|nr:phosphoglucomutase [Bacteroidales bacterium]
LFYYMLNAWKDAGKLNGNQYIVKTIVTTELLVEMAKKFGVEYYDVLTGFKFIAEILGQNEGKKDFIIGGEESYGYLAGDFIRDKDAVMSGALIAEMLAWAKSKNTSALDLLAKIYVEYGFYYEGLVNVEKHGMQGASEIKQIMTDFRKNPPKKMDGFEIVKIKDYEVQKEFDLIAKTEKPINLPKSDVLQFVAADGTQISVRPSGTEPKIKFYFGVKLPMQQTTEFNAKIDEAKAKIKRIANELSL